MRVEITSSALLHGDWKRTLDECRDFAEKVQWQFGVQLHNTAPEEQLAALSRERIPLSVHSPFNQAHNWNLASFADLSGTFRSIAENLELYRKYGIDRTVFHAAVMSDLQPEAFGHGKSYWECMKPLWRAELSCGPESQFNRDFRSLPEFRERHMRLKENLARLRKEYPDFIIAVENDFPAYGSMNMAVDSLLELEHPFCLDTGHLWISSHFYHWDFQREVARAAASKQLVMCHFHASIYDDSYADEDWADGHQPLATPNAQMNLPAAARTLWRAGLEHWVLEIIHATVADLQTLHTWLHTS